MSFFLIDGGIYTFLYALVLTCFLVLFNMVPIKELYVDVKHNPISALLIIIGFLLVSSTKIIPGLTSTKLPDIEPLSQMTFRDIGLSLFYPLQTNIDWNQMHTHRFHEIGCYIGILSLAIICLYLRKKSFWRENTKEILLTLMLS